MSNQITGKQKKISTGEWGKHPRKFLKRVGNKRLRSSESPRSLDALFKEVPQSKIRNTRKSKRKRSGICPVCMNKLNKNNKGTRYWKFCQNCGAAPVKDIKCPSCGTFRVWKGKMGAFCKGCGAKVDI
jgi:predicted amidophosphoribosyltransferase